MKQELGKIKSFTDLKAWQQSHELVLLIYQETVNFPSSEIFGLSSQLRRAVVSISSNIAEGFSRKSSKEKLQFYYMSIASLTEVQNQLLIAKDVGYITRSKFNALANQSIVISKLINGLIKKIRNT